MKAKNLTLFFFLFVGNTSIFCKNTLEEADKYFTQKSYQKAVTLYEMIMVQMPSGILANKIAHTYFKLRQFEKSVEFYRIASAIQPLSDTQQLEFIEALIACEKYLEARLTAKKNLSIYNSRNIFIKLDSIEAWRKQPMKNSVINLSMNTKANEFGLIPFNQNDFLFSSDDIQISLQNSKKDSLQEKFLSLFAIGRDHINASTGIRTALLNTGKNYHEAYAYYDPLNNKLYYSRNLLKGKKLFSDKHNKAPLGIVIADVVDGLNLTNIKEFKYNNINYSISHPSLSKDGQRLYFVSDMPGGYGGTDIFYCQRLENGEWDNPVNAGVKINTEKNEMFPYISVNNNLVFASDGHIGFGGLDLFKSKIDSPFGSPINLGFGLNSSYDDFALIYDNFGETTGFFSSNRPEGKGGDDIYKFESILKSNDQFKNLKLILVDIETKENLSGGIINVLDLITNDSNFVITNKNGIANVRIKKNGKYAFQVKRSDYLISPFDNLDITKDEIILSIHRKTKDLTMQLKNIYYEFDKSDIHPAATIGLNKLVELLNQNADIQIEIMAHTDSRGDDKYNMSLSQNRADAVVNYLTKMGISNKRLMAKGYGESRPINHCANGIECLEEEHVQNRRTEFKITDIIGKIKLESETDVKLSLQVSKIQRPSKIEAKPRQSSIVNDIDNSSLGSQNALTYYTVQIGLFKNSASINNLKNIKGIHILKHNESYIALVGKYSTENEAKEFRKALIQNQPNAFVVKIVNGIRELINK